jgi:hypothetical protein
LKWTRYDNEVLDGELYFLQKDKCIADEAPKGWKDGKYPKPFELHLKVEKNEKFNETLFPALGAIFCGASRNAAA